MKARAQRLDAIARKLDQALTHAEGIRGSIGAGDYNAAWAAAVHFRKTLIASKHLIDQDRRVSRVEGSASGKVKR